jgi:hypothetical protein
MLTNKIQIDTMIVHNKCTKKGVQMLDRVKQKLESSKTPLVPISLRIEESSKTAISLLSDSYGVKSNELVRYILQAFVEEAQNETVNSVWGMGSVPLGEELQRIHPEINPNLVSIQKGFSMHLMDKNLGDTPESMQSNLSEETKK